MEHSLMTKPKSKVRKVKAWVHMHHLTEKGREQYDKTQEVFYGKGWGGIGTVPFVFTKPANPDFLPVTITYTLPKPSKKTNTK